MKRVFLLAVLMWCVACAPTEEVQEGVARVQKSPTATPIVIPTTHPFSPAVDIIIKGKADHKMKEEIVPRLSEIGVETIEWIEHDDDWAINLEHPERSATYVLIVDESKILYESFAQVLSPRLISTTDLSTSDTGTLPKLLLHYRDCGSNCTDYYSAVQKRADGQYEVIPGGYSTMRQSFAEELSVTTFEGEKVFALYGGLNGYTGMMLGEAYQRKNTVYWRFNNETEQFEEVGYVLDDPIYRFHALHDANRLFHNGEYKSAESLYEQIVTDTTKYEDPPPATTTYDGTRRYAGFRLVLVNMILGNEAKVSEWSQWLTETYSGSMVADAIPLLIDSDDELSTKCQAVTDYLGEQETIRGEKAAGAIAYEGNWLVLPYDSFCPVQE